MHASSAAKYQDIYPEISKAADKKFSNHLWYLAPETVALSMFDDNVPTEVKSNMARVMLEADKGEEAEEEKHQIGTLCTKMIFVPFQIPSFCLL